MILDQIHDSDYAHLRPKRDSLFSDDENDLSDEDNEDASGARVKAEEEGATEGRSSDERKGKRKADDRDLNELELERRKELEAHYGVDGSRRNVSPPPPLLFFPRSPGSTFLRIVHWENLGARD